ncbi:MAG: histidine kinase N-terminal 7TM domain-containing protein, partial [Anaerolineales bacterium]
MDNFSFSLPVLLLFVSTLVSISLGVFIFTRRRAPGSVALGVLALLIAEWSLTYGLEIAIPGLAAKIFWAQWQYIGIAFIPFAWLLFAVFYTRQDNLNRRLAFVHLLGILPLITVAMVFTNETHGLIWSRTFLNTIGELSVLGNEHGAWFWVHFAVSYVFLLVGAVILLRGLRRMQGLYRAQIWALFFGVALPWVGNIVYFVTPIAIDPTPFAFTITIALLAWAIFGYRLTDIAPIARDLVVEGLREGLIVLDMQGRIVDVNTAAARFIGLPPTQIIGRPSAEILQPWQGTMERFRGVLEAQEIVEIGRGEAVRQMEVRIAPLYDNRRNLAGRLITFLEIRERSYRAPSAGDEPLTQPLPQQSVAKPAPEMTAQPWSLVQKIGTFFNPPLLKLSTDNQSADETAWQQTIERIFVVTLRVLLSLATPLWLVTVNYFLARNLPLWLVLGSVLTLLWGLSLSRNIAYGVRVGIFLSVFYLVGLVLVLSYGYSPESFATLLFFIALSGMFLKNRGRAIAFSIAALTVALIGWLIIAGAYLPFAVSLPRLRPSSMETFLASLLSYFVLSGSMILIVSVVFRNLTLAIQQETQTRNLLQQERDLLEKRVRERTADLREARDLALQSRDELRKYYQAIEQSGNSIVITDVQGNIQYVNPFFEKITGYTLNEVLGKNPRFLKSGNQPLEFYRFMWKTIANGQVWRGEFLNRRKDGSLYWELATIAPVKDDKGKVTNYVAIKEDITAQKELRETLARQNDYLATLQTITLDLLNRRDQQELLETIMQRGMSLLKAERATIALLEDGQLVYSGVMGEHASQKGQVVPRDSMSLMWQAFETRRPVFVDDFTAKFGPRPTDAGGTPLRAVADFPILSGGKALGVLGLGRESDKPFTSSEIEFGQALAQIAALVLDNITLYQSAVRELDERKRIQASLEVSEQEQRALASVLQTGMRDAPIEDILLSSLEQLLAIEWLGIEAKGGIFLKDPQKDTLHLVVERNLSPQICALCKKVDFGKCLCGRAALTRQLQFSSHVDDLHEINYEGMN